jgi:bacterioferritin-associated ferredoxin
MRGCDDVGLWLRPDAERDKMIVCICNNVSDREIRRAVDLGLNTMTDLRRDLGVGTCCGKCHSCAKKILQECNEQASVATA